MRTQKVVKEDNEEYYKLQRTCSQCKFYIPKGRTCRMNPERCKGQNGKTCADWVYKFRLSGIVYCKYMSADIDSGVCRTCRCRCIRSESRREIDYARVAK